MFKTCQMPGISKSQYLLLGNKLHFLLSWIYKHERNYILKNHIITKPTKKPKQFKCCRFVLYSIESCQKHKNLWLKLQEEMEKMSNFNQYLNILLTVHTNCWCIYT